MDEHGGTGAPRQAFSVLAAATNPWQAGATAAADDFDLLVKLAKRHRVVPLLAARLADAQPPGGGSGPAEAWRSQLAGAARAAFADELQMLACLRNVADALHGKRIDFVLLKGLSLSYRAYGRLGMRSNRDIDILVDPSAIPDANRALQAIGFAGVEPGDLADAAALHGYLVKHKDLIYRHKLTGIVLELHARLFDNATLCTGPMATSSVLARAEPARLFDQIPIKLMNRTDEVPYLALHGAMHAWSRLKWLADFGQCVRGLAPGELHAVRQAACRQPTGAALAQGLALLADIYAPDTLPPLGARSWRTRKLVRIAHQSLVGSGTAEIEDSPNLTTFKNLSHYLLYFNVSYLGKEIAFDLGDMSRDGHQPSGPLPAWLVRIGLWLKRRVLSGSA